MNVGLNLEFLSLISVCQMRNVARLFIYKYTFAHVLKYLEYICNTKKNFYLREQFFSVLLGVKSEKEKVKEGENKT